MKTNMKHGSWREENGQALVAVLGFMLLGSLLITPLLQFMGTGLKAGLTHENKMAEFYAADAGINDGFWQVKNEALLTKFAGYTPSYDPFDFVTDNWTYTLGEAVNDFGVDVSVGNVWIPFGLPAPEANEARDIIEGTGGDPPKFVVAGVGVTPPVGVSPGAYKVKVYYYPTAGEDPTINTLGIWLPAGFTYVSGSSNLESDAGNPPYHSVPTVTPHASGQAVVWDFADVAFVDFPFVDTSATPMESTITFQYNADPGKMPAAVSWLNTDLDLGGGITHTWDADKKVYKITSTADDTTIDAYTIRVELRQMAAAIEGDYRAIGNSLMLDNNNNHERETLLSNSGATVAGIPQDAQVALAYLYWAGWFESQISQTRVPTGDSADSGGTWNTTPYWNDVDEDEDGATAPPSPNDSDYFQGVSTSGGSAYRLFTFSPFAMPNGVAVNDLTIHIRARDIDSGSNRTGNIRGYIKVAGAKYVSATSHTTPNSFTTYHDFTWTMNPNTGAPWTLEDINGTGPSPLQEFGVQSIDLDPDVRISMLYAQVNYLVADTSAVFKIDGDQVYFNAGVPTEGAGELTIDFSNPLDMVQLDVDDSEGVAGGYFYSCRKDVTDLVKAFSAKAPDPATNHPGNGVYNVGDVDADVLDQKAFAGWSLVVVYTSDNTQGHQLYLYDTMITSIDDSNVDFDQDNQPGGTITGFFVPEPVAGEVNAAKMTVFIGEGDDWLAPDRLVFEGTALNDGFGTNNVWNGKSVGMTAEGVDVDTFLITWASGLLEPGDVSVQIDMETGEDTWQLIYFILSFRSETTGGGTLSYLIRD